MRSNMSIHRRARLELLRLDTRILPSFTPLAPFMDGPIDPAQAVSADFNGDGREDVAVYNSTGGMSGSINIAILLSTGDGQFVQSDFLDQLSSSIPRALIADDFNGDGNVDLASGSQDFFSSVQVASGGLSSFTLRVYLGNGDGTFAPSYSDGVSALGLGSGDFDADGDRDIVAFLDVPGPDQYAIYRNDGSGQFTVLAPTAVASFNNNRIATGDIDGNGTLDFVSTSSSGSIAAYLGNGNGTFGAAVITTVSGGIGEFVVGRFDADARPDIVTLEGSSLVLHRNLGGGQFDAAGVPFFNFSTGGVQLASVDFDADGFGDVVANEVFNNASVLYGSAAGTFSQDARNPYPIGFFGDVLTTGDFDGDRRPDFAFLGGNGDPDYFGKVFLNDLPDSTITTLSVEPARATVGTPITLTAVVTPQFLGHDTPQGTVTFTAGSTVLGTVTLVNGVATLVVSTLPPGPYSIIATYSGSPAVFQDPVNISPRGSALLPSQSVPVALVIRRPEAPAFVVGTDNGPVVVLRDGTGANEERYGDFSAPFPGVRPALGDFNGDGRSDIVGGSGPGIAAQVTVVDGVTREILHAVQPFDGFLGGVFVASADFNGDGVADFAVGADAGGEPRICIYLTLDGALVRVASFYAFDQAFRGGVRVAAGDVNGDGTPDLIVGAGPGAEPVVAVFDGSLLLSNVAARFRGDVLAYDSGFRGGVFVAAGDVNGDGYADIITGAGLGASHVTAISGLSLFAEKVAVIASFYATDEEVTGGVRVAAHDLDLDGFADIIAGAGLGNGNAIRIFSGLTLTTNGVASSIFADEVFPGLFAGVHVG